MAQIKVTRRGQKTKREKIKEKAQKKGFVYADSDTLEPEQQPDDERDMEVLELSEDDDEPQDWTDEERPGFGRSGGVRPLWLLYGGQILWAADDIHFNTKELEFFRRRLQHLLDFLIEEFPSYRDREEGLLTALQGFFVRGRRVKTNGERKSDPRGWTYHLSSVGIVLKTGRRLPLSEFLAGKGTGKEIEGRAGLPDGLLNLWLERELADHLKDIPLEKRRQVKRPTVAALWRDMAAADGENAPSLTECKGQMLAGLKEFCDALNKRCDAFVPEMEEDGKGKEAAFELGLGAREFGYGGKTGAFENTVRRWRRLPAMRPFFEEVKA